MRRPGNEVDPELAAFLSGRQAERSLRPDVRARVLARSWASIRGDRAAAAAVPLDRRRSSPLPIWRRFGLARVALVTVILAGAAGALAALHERAVGGNAGPLASAPYRAPLSISTESTEAGPTVSPKAPAVASRRAVVTKPALGPRDDRALSREVELVERAHLACARHDYSVALALIQEHGRRFPHGPLAEEREALRIESLAGLGFTDEAGRRAAVFATLFPRSVLLPRVREALKATTP